MGDYIGYNYRVIKGYTRSLDYSPCIVAAKAMS